MSNLKDSFDGLVLDDEEQAIEDAIERGEFAQAPLFENTKKMLQQAARDYRQLRTSRPITLRVNQLDLT